MDIENQIVEIRVTSYNLQHLLNIGYNVKDGEIIKIPAKHLSSGSGTKIDVVCNYCGKVFKKSWRRYLETKNDICCKDCRWHKTEKIFIDKYGIKCPLWNPDIHQKVIESNIKHFGATHHMKNKEFCSNFIRDVFGFDINSSKNQRYLCNLYDGILNYKIEYYYFDIYLGSNIICEYDGSGHDLGYRLGTVTLDNFRQNEINRQEFLKRKGFKLFRIFHRNDKQLFSEKYNKELLDIKNIALEYLKTHSIFIYDFDNKKQLSEKSLYI